MELDNSLQDEILSYHADIEDVCPSGEHEIIESEKFINHMYCKKCKVSTQTLTDWLGHDL